MHTSLPVIEWSPRGVRGYDTAHQRWVPVGTLPEVLTALGQPKEVGLALARGASFVRSLRIPDVGRDEAMPVIKMQLSQLFPMPETDLAFDFSITGDRTSEGRLVVIGASRAQVVKDARSALRQHGVTVKWVAPAAFGSWLALAERHPNSVYVELEGGMLSIDVIRARSIAASREVPSAGDPEGIESELKLSLASAQLHDAEVFGSGDVGITAKSMTVHPLQALAQAAEPINIEPYEELEGRRLSRVTTRRRLATLLWCGVAVVAMLVGFDRFDETDRHQRAAAEVQRELRTLREARQAAQSRVNEGMALSTRLQRAMNPAQNANDVLTVVANALPSGVWLTNLTYERGRPLQVRGTARSEAAVSESVRSLGNLDRLRDVQLVFANNAMIERTPVIQFSITARVVGNLPLEERAPRRGR